MRAAPISLVRAATLVRYLSRAVRAPSVSSTNSVPWLPGCERRIRSASCSSFRSQRAHVDGGLAEAACRCPVVVDRPEYSRTYNSSRVSQAGSPNSEVGNSPSRSRRLSRISLAVTCIRRSLERGSASPKCSMDRSACRRRSSNGPGALLLMVGTPDT